MSVPAWPRRPRLVAGNWKMHKTAEEAAALARAILGVAGADPGCALVVCPAFTALSSVAPILEASPVMLGAQNLHAEPEGAFTGEISGPMLAAAGCRWVIVGHSERRHGMGEDDVLVARKLRAALRSGLSPILCVGETLEQRERGETNSLLERQVRAAVTGLSAHDLAATVIAYEPVWAIGTGKVATPGEASSAHHTIRGTLDREAGTAAGAAMAILYGGSVNPKNAADLFGQAEIDGALVGGASLEAASFWAIAEAARR